MRWADFATPTTDYDGLIAAVRDRAAAFEYRWCPGFDLTPVLHQIRRLPRSRAGHLRREERKREARRAFIESAPRLIARLEAETELLRSFEDPRAMVEMTADDVAALKAVDAAIGAEFEKLLAFPKALREKVAVLLVAKRKKPSTK